MREANEAGNPDAAAMAGLTAALLGLGEGLDRWSLGLAGAALLGLLLKEAASPGLQMALGASLAAGAGQKAHALRVALDRPLFADWATRWAAQGEDACPARDMAALDRALAAAGLRRHRAGNAAVRSLASRAQGARGLLVRQAVFLGLQALLLLGAVLAGFLDT